MSHSDLHNPIRRGMTLVELLIVISILVMLAAIAIPTLWLNGANDRAYPLSIHGRTYPVCGGERNLSVRVGLGHSHIAGWKPVEIYAYADSVIGDGTPFMRITSEGHKDGEVWAEYDPRVVPSKAELVYTDDVKDWVECEWHKQPAEYKKI